MIARFSNLWFRFQQSLTTWYYAQQLGISKKSVIIGGACVIHGGGNFVVGKNVAIRSTPRLPVELYCSSGAALTLADGCFLNQGVHIACCKEIYIGEQCLIADQALIMDSDFHGVVMCFRSLLRFVLSVVHGSAHERLFSKA